MPHTFATSATAIGTQNIHLHKEASSMNPVLIVAAIVGGLTGGLATVYLIISLPATIIFKLYRRITKGIPVMK